MQHFVRPRSSFSLIWLGACAASVACNAFDEPPTGGGSTRTVRVIPTDERPVAANAMPLAVSGGTLLSLGAQQGLAVADPDRDQVTVGQLGANGTPDMKTLSLPKGSEPGRMAMIGASRFAVALRGSGEVLAIDARDATSAWQTKVCNAPRGLDYELATDQVHVACAEGTLVTLDASSGEVLTRTLLEPDLRDVVAKDGRLYVSRFRSAEVLFVENGAIARRVELPTVRVMDEFFGNERTMKPAVAWRMQSNPLGGVAVVHQRATTDEVPIDSEGTEHSDLGGSTGSPYGGAGGCGGIVQVAVTQIDATGERRTTGSLSGITLPVDFTFSPDGSTFAIADAGMVDPESPRPTLRHLSGSGDHGGSVVTMGGFAASVTRFEAAQFVPTDTVPTQEGELPVLTCTGALGFETVTEPVTALAYDGDILIAQDQRMNLLRSTSGHIAAKQLPGDVMLNTGHEVFHRDSGGGLACASCHPEGTSDGHVWTFTGLGPRRTQDLAIPLAETAPFHWDGELSDVNALMDEVFVERMGGVFESKERLEVLGKWLAEGPKPVRTATQLSEAAERGKVLFESAEVGCATCHVGKAFTDNRDYFVGTSELKLKLQVPSLVGIAARPPFMHDGCAKTLLDRFDPECGGGDLHGKTSQLSSADLSDLVAYMETL